MSYMLLIVEPPEQRLARTNAEGREAYARMQAFGEDLKRRGLLVAVESLKSQADGARVSVRNGRPQIIDGPFAEAKRWSAASSSSTARPGKKPWRSRPSARQPSGARWRFAPSHLATSEPRAISNDNPSKSGMVGALAQR